MWEGTGVEKGICSLIPTMLDRPFSFTDRVGKEHSHGSYRVHVLAYSGFIPLSFEYNSSTLSFWSHCSASAFVF